MFCLCSLLELSTQKQVVVDDTFSVCFCCRRFPERKIFLHQLGTSAWGGTGLCREWREIRQRSFIQNVSSKRQWCYLLSHNFVCRLQSWRRAARNWAIKRLATQNAILSGGRITGLGELSCKWPVWRSIQKEVTCSSTAQNHSFLSRCDDVNKKSGEFGSHFRCVRVCVCVFGMEMCPISFATACLNNMRTQGIVLQS